MKQQTPSAIEQLAQIKPDRRNARIKFYKKITSFIGNAFYISIFIGLVFLVLFSFASMVKKVSDTCENDPKLEKRIANLESLSMSKENYELFSSLIQIDRQRMSSDESTIQSMSERIFNLEHPEFKNMVQAICATNAISYGTNYYKISN